MFSALIPLFVVFVAIAAALYRRRFCHKAPDLVTSPVAVQHKAAKHQEPTKYCRAVVLYSKDGPYTLVDKWPRPSISSKELLIETRAIGLNPIDWKCVTYGFGVHAIPWISGREAAGTVEEVGSDVPGFQKGDRVFLTSTNYRDNRTSTFQEAGGIIPSRDTRMSC